ncbi:nicotinate-nucleotide adenylyltransferase [Bacillus mesophilus]|uniref:Probable nicotinate-nucleotide adenylyltransferase n=1 Tax=Bacillus mesophilus TaxID=1808955 RepID=A0A6M0Q5V9_9BACI|nr:nicotinate-nucleotide adenylyltransferase [Bacillus mesophilus]MBM7660761.1 nicotinate-nucleotide adenylyltransferase [Bacillus mesophilus]NEY71692.1 nicotinate-nucleotide adenylyltransferase [Bacillus mesophilus]
MKKIGILGGTFDPPHNGHLLIAYEVLHALSLDEIWFMPAHVPPHKQGEHISSSKHRLHMLELALVNHDRFKVQPIELEREGRSYSYDTIRLLKQQYSGDELYFIIGGDMIEYLPKWYKIDELIKMITFVGVGRTGFSTSSKFPIIHVETPLFEVSSSFIRDRIKIGGNTELLLPSSVKKYIEENHIYE